VTSGEAVGNVFGYLVFLYISKKTFVKRSVRRHGEGREKDKEIKNKEKCTQIIYMWIRNVLNMLCHQLHLFSLAVRDIRNTGLL
jgi:hypothetical protein